MRFFARWRRRRRLASRRHVRVHLANVQPSIDGLYAGEDKRYVFVEQVVVLVSANQSIAQSSKATWVPQPNVAWIEEDPPARRGDERTTR